MVGSTTDILAGTAWVSIMGSTLGPAAERALGTRAIVDMLSVYKCSSALIGLSLISFPLENA